MHGERKRAESGMVTVELAVGIVTLLLVLSLVLGVARVGLDRATALSAAAVLAREAGRGGDLAGAWEAARTSLPDGAHYVRSVSGGFVTVSVGVPGRGGVVGMVLPELGPVRAVARLERP